MFLGKNDGMSFERNVEKAIEVNDMYIESIKAKLMMLDKIWLNLINYFNKIY